MQIGQAGGFRGSWFLMFAMRCVALDEDSLHAQVAAEFYVAEGVADDQAGGWFDLRKLGLRLFEEAGERFAAVALMLIVRAEVETVDFGSGFGQQGLKLVVDFVDGRGGVEAEGYAALVGDDEDTQAGLIEPRDGLGDAGEQFEVLPVGDVLALGHLAVENAVAVEKDGAEDGAKVFAGCAVWDAVLIGAFWLGLHPAIIAIS